MDWQPFDLSSPPAEPGIYAIRSGERWLYIGRAEDVGRRVQKRQHPAQITRGLASMELSYWWFPCAEHQRRTENRLIREHEPEWNGGTEWRPNTAGPSCWCPSGVSDEEVEQALAAVLG